jgi:hypothetical protein
LSWRPPDQSKNPVDEEPITLGFGHTALRIFSIRENYRAVIPVSDGLERAMEEMLNARRPDRAKITYRQYLLP